MDLNPLEQLIDLIRILCSDLDPCCSGLPDTRHWKLSLEIEIVFRVWVFVLRMEGLNLKLGPD